MRHLADVAAMKSNAATQRQFLADGMARLLDVDVVSFYVGDQWRSTKPACFSHMTVNSGCDARFQKHSMEFGIQFPMDADAFCYASRRDGRKRGHWTLRDVLPKADEPQRADAFMDLRRTLRHRDGLISYYRTGADDDRIVGLSVHQLRQARPLSQRQSAMLSFAVSEIERLVQCGHFVLPPGEVGQELSQRLRQILGHLLAGKNPKQIARELGLSVWTVREHIQRLYRHFDVPGLQELMARFVHP